MVPTLAFAPDSGTTANIDVSSSSQRVSVGPAIGTNALADWVTVRVTNLGTAAAWINSGDVTVTATTSNIPIPLAPFTEVMRFRVPATGQLYIAAIAAGSTGKIYFTPGIGV